MSDAEDLPDKKNLLFTQQYSIKLEHETKRRIDIINGYKDGLTMKVRTAIKETVDAQWDRLQARLKAEDQSA